MNSTSSYRSRRHSRQEKKDDMIRSRFFSKLGIGARVVPSTGHQDVKSNSSTHRSSTPKRQSKRRLLRDVVPFVEPLKNKEAELTVPQSASYESSSSDTVSTSSSSSCSSSSSQSSRIKFMEEVAGVPIPMRSEYSSRVRGRIWSNRFEISENAQRNAVEFAAEGWDWRRATEDDQMYTCAVSGERIHPVHCEPCYSH